MANQKPVHTIVLDAGPILRNDPSISTLLAESDELLTVPSVLSEIKDRDTRSRVEVTVRPFLTLRTPSPASIQVITEFAKKTGDFAVLSAPDIQVLSLAYEVECERNGGDWRLRKVPGQKKINGPPPTRQDSNAPASDSRDKDPTVVEQLTSSNNITSVQSIADDGQGSGTDKNVLPDEPILTGIASAADVISQLNLKGSDGPENSTSQTEKLEDQRDCKAASDGLGSDSSDSEGWITPSNLKRHQIKDAGTSMKSIRQGTTLQVAVLTTDFAMQNVLLSMGLNLISSSMQQVRNIKTYILRCHACFETTKDMTKQFCSRCGKPTLTRVTCSTNQNGKFTIHLKKNMQWNHRGDRFSIPKPVAGTANGKPGASKGGGKGGWGQELILAEDQKEYVRARRGQSHTKKLDLMDQDYLPGILTGQRGREGDRVMIGGGRNINARKR
jgi:RNA-binding protein NOB1